MQRGTIGGYSSFNREWVNHQVGAAMDYGYRSDSFHTLNSFGISRGEEYAYGTYKYEPGRYFTYLYNVQFAKTDLPYWERCYTKLTSVWDWQQGYADEYRQQLIIKNDPQIGTTSYTYEKQLEFRKRYQVRTFDCAFRYRANFLNDAPSRSSSAGNGLPQRLYWLFNRYAQGKQSSSSTIVII